MSIIDQIRLHYPLPVAKLYETMHLESEPYQRVHKLIDLFEGVTRYLVLVGLASYIYQELSAIVVEELRPDLTRPSLGHWVNLLKALDPTLRSNNIISLISDPNHIHKEDAISHTTQALAQITGASPSKKIRLIDFLSAIVNFRNRKIGHGRLSPREAKQVVEPLETGLLQWLKELAVLYEQQLVYIDRVEWRNPHFAYFGTHLNSGTFLTPFKLNRDKPVTPEQVYLYNQTSDILIPLYPFVVFEKDTHLLYVYDELFEKRELILRCPYDAPSAQPAYRLSFDESIIVGTSSLTNLVTPDKEIQKETQGVEVSKYLETINRIRANLTETWLTDSQKSVWTQLNKLMGPPYYVVNIYGITGSGKTFLGWLLQKQGRAIYANEGERNWTAWQGQPLVVLDGYDSSRRAVRSLQAQLQLSKIGQVIILTRQKAQDDIPCLHLAVTDRDIQIAKANLYRELNLAIPDGARRNLWECLKHLEA